MKFFYILNKKNKLIEFGKISSKRFLLLESIIGKIHNTPFLELKSFNIITNDIENEITKLLAVRNSNPLDISNYGERFSENEVFETKQFKNQILNLSNTGFDNSIIFLINIYNSLLEEEKPYFLLFTNNHTEFNDWLANNTDNQTISKFENIEIEESNIKPESFLFFDGLKTHNVFNQYDDYLNSTDYSVWSNLYVEIECEKFYFVKENTKILFTFSDFNREELQFLAEKYSLEIKEQNNTLYLYSLNHEMHQFEISENNSLVVIYAMEGSKSNESIFIYGVFKK